MERMTKIMGMVVLLVTLTWAGGWLPHRASVPPPQISSGQSESGGEANALPKDAAISHRSSPARPSALSRAAGSSLASAPVLSLAEQIPALEQAAGQGDTVAACRLMAHARRCAAARELSKYQTSDEEYAQQLASIEADSDPERTQRWIDELVANQHQLQQVVAQCEGMNTSVKQLARYEQWAAAAGDSYSRQRYLAGDSLIPGLVLQHPELLQEYRTQAPIYFEQALEEGDLMMLVTWINALNMSEYSAFPHILPEHWREPGFADALLGALSQEQRESLLSHHGLLPQTDTTTPAQQAEAARIHARYFQNSVLAPPAPFMGEDNDPLSYVPGSDVSRCDAASE